jgi:hypothetical protein
MTPDDDTAHIAWPALWLSEITKGTPEFAMTASGAPPGVARISIVASIGGDVGQSRQAARACFAVQRPSRQSARRLANRNLFKQVISLAHIQLSLGGTSFSICFNQ